MEFRIDASGDVFEAVEAGQSVPFDPDRFGWVQPSHRRPADMRRSLDQIASLPGFTVTQRAGPSFIPGLRPARSVRWGAWIDGAAPPAAARPHGGEGGTVSYTNRLSDAFGLVAERLPLMPERSPFIVNDFVNGREYEISFVAPALSPSGDGIVYVLDDGEAFKIGHTRSHVAAIVNGLQTGNPRVICAVGTIGPANESVESQLHSRLGNWRLRGEWFNRSEILIAIDQAGGWENFLREVLGGEGWTIHIYPPYSNDHLPQGRTVGADDQDGELSTTSQHSDTASGGYLVVTFRKPVTATDPDTGAESQDVRHRVAASSVRHNAISAEFVDGETVVASWPTDLIASIQWPEDLLDIGAHVGLEVDPLRQRPKLRNVNKSPVSKVGTPWSEADEEELRIGYLQGLTLTQLANRLGRNVKGIERRLVHLARIEMVESNPPTIPERQRSGQPWLPSEDDSLKQSHAQGMLIAELAAKHGRSISAILSRLEKLGLRN